MIGGMFPRFHLNVWIFYCIVRIPTSVFVAEISVRRWYGYDSHPYLPHRQHFFSFR
jgi:hypothetical protein